LTFADGPLTNWIIVTACAAPLRSAAHGTDDERSWPGRELRNLVGRLCAASDRCVRRPSLLLRKLSVRPAGRCSQSLDLQGFDVPRLPGSRAAQRQCLRLMV